ncbi:MAG: SDR family NAD(P)-dependent oxidoreductase [Patescibacteria group bacterium]
MSTVFITGAASGIGRALAKTYAAPGVVLGLADVQLDTLAFVAESCQLLGARVLCYAFDVRDPAAARQAAAAFHVEASQVDIVIANAGVCHWKYPVELQAEDVIELLDINLKGVINTLVAFLPIVTTQRAGQLVAISSISAFLDLPCGMYAVSKAGVLNYMNSLRMDVEPYGISVTTICPGFIATAMAANAAVWYPFLLSSSKLAGQAKRAIKQRQQTVILPWQWRLLLPFLRLVPNRFVSWVAQQLRQR